MTPDIELKLEIPFTDENPEMIKRWEGHLMRNEIVFTKKISGGIPIYKVTVHEPIQAFWLGCNLVAMTNKLYDSPIMITG